MIETREAMDALDAILDVDGIDGVFVGPSDLSIALSKGGRVDPFDADMLAAAETIASRAAKRGKFAGIFSFSAAAAKRFHGMGFRLINMSGDIHILTAGAAALMSAAAE